MPNTIDCIDPTEFEGCFDAPDPSDYLAEDMVGSTLTSPLPEELNLLTKVFYIPKNQENTVKCTAYGSTGTHEVANNLEMGSFVPIFNPNKLWDVMETLGKTTSSGATLQDAIKTLVSVGSDSNGDDVIYKVKGYALVTKNVDEYKRVLNEGLPIFTGAPVTDINFRTARDTGVWGGLEGQRKTGHAFFIVGYGVIPDDGRKAFLCMNSYGNWGKYKNGTFWILENDINLTFSAYVIYDEVEKKMIFADVPEDHIYAKEIQHVLNKGIMMGEGFPEEPDPKKRNFSPNRPITRAELAVVISRLFP